MNRTFAVKVPGTLGRMSPEALSELIETIAHDLVAAGKAGTLTDDLIPETAKFAVMRPKDRAHGDWASNAAMQEGRHEAARFGRAVRRAADRRRRHLDRRGGGARLHQHHAGFRLRRRGGRQGAGRWRRLRQERAPRRQDAQPGVRLRQPDRPDSHRRHPLGRRRRLDGPRAGGQRRQGCARILLQRSRRADQPFRKVPGCRRARRGDAH